MSTILGAIIVSVSFMEAISVFFILIVVFSYRENGSHSEAHEQQIVPQQIPDVMIQKLG